MFEKILTLVPPYRVTIFWPSGRPKKWIHSEREHLEHTAQRFARHAHVILTTLWLITYRK